jgi:hypothetical protein
VLALCKREREREREMERARERRRETEKERGRRPSRRERRGINKHTNYFSLLSRRGAPTSGDVDILITHPNFDESKKNLSKDFLNLITAELKKSGYIKDDLSNGR